MTPLLTPSDFAKRWGSGLQPVTFRPKPYLPSDSSRFYRDTGFPSCFRIKFYRELKFQTECVPLSIVWQQIQGDEWKMPHSWNAFWKIGDAEFGQATAWLCIEELTGRIVTVDPEVADNPVLHLSSSPIKLAACMLLYKEWFVNAGSRPIDEQCREHLTVLSEHNAFDDGDGRRFWFPSGFLNDDDPDMIGDGEVIEIETS
jgi:hypothetical protein